MSDDPPDKCAAANPEGSGLGSRRDAASPVAQKLRWDKPLGAGRQWASQACHDRGAPIELIASRIVIGRGSRHGGIPPRLSAAVAELDR